MLIVTSACVPTNTGCSYLLARLLLWKYLRTGSLSSFFHLTGTIHDSSVKPAEWSINASYNLCCTREFLEVVGHMRKIIPYGNCTKRAVQIPNDNDIEYFLNWGFLDLFCYIRFVDYINSVVLNPGYRFRITLGAFKKYRCWVLHLEILIYCSEVRMGNWLIFQWDSN